MKENNKIVRELVHFVREQKKINQRLEKFVKEQSQMNREQRQMNIQSEKRFRLFYHLITTRK